MENNNNTTEVSMAKTKSLAVMDEPAIEALDYLAGELTAKDLVKFNPLAVAAADLESLKEHKFVSIEDDENHQVYKDAKKVVGKFNSTLKETKKELKDRHITINRNIETIVKKFMEVSNGVKEYLETEFKPFDDERERKKKEAEERKNKKLREEMEATKKAQEESDKKLRVSNLVNKVKYDIIAEYKNQVLLALPQLSLKALNSDRTQLENFGFLSLLGRHNMNMSSLDELEGNEVEGLQMIFNDMLNFVKKAYDDRIREVNDNDDLRISLETEKRVNSTKSFERVEPQQKANQMEPFGVDTANDLPQAPGPMPPSDTVKTVKQEIDSLLLKIQAIRDHSHVIGSLSNANPQEVSILRAINTMMSRANDYLEPLINKSNI